MRTRDMWPLETVTTAPFGPVSTENAFGTVRVPLREPFAASLLTVAVAHTRCGHGSFSTTSPSPVPANIRSLSEIRADDNRRRLAVL